MRFPWSRKPKPGTAEYYDNLTPEQIDREFGEGVPVAIKPKRLSNVFSVRFTADQSEELFRICELRGMTVSELLRAGVRLMAEPTGWVCEHTTITAGTGLVSISGACGCEMRPVYRAA